MRSSEQIPKPIQTVYKLQWIRKTVVINDSRDELKQLGQKTNTNQVT